jgi:hypothetical protein
MTAMDRDAIQAIIPHRDPFLFVDEIVALEPGVSAHGRWTITGDEWFLQGHFPGTVTLLNATPLAYYTALTTSAASAAGEGAAGISAVLARGDGSAVSGGASRTRAGSAGAVGAAALAARHCHARPARVLQVVQHHAAVWALRQWARAYEAWGV